jgi:hypothetical protein
MTPSMLQLSNVWARRSADVVALHWDGSNSEVLKTVTAIAKPGTLIKIDTITGALSFMWALDGQVRHIHRDEVLALTVGTNRGKYDALTADQVTDIEICTQSMFFSLFAARVCECGDCT